MVYLLFQEQPISASTLLNVGEKRDAKNHSVTQKSKRDAKNLKKNLIQKNEVEDTF
jgi:hypothetical protein